MEDFSTQVQNLSRATMRVAVYIRRKDLRLRFEKLAFDMVEDAAKREWENLILNTNALIGLVQLAVFGYEIETVNAQILLEALNNLGFALKKEHGLEVSSDELRTFFDKFDKQDNAANTSNDMRQSAMSQNMEIQPANMNREPLPVSSVSFADSPTSQAYTGNNSATEQKVQEGEFADSNINNINHSSMVSIGSVIRQSAILERVKSLSVKDGNGHVIGCRMRDLLAAFPDVSERTLRNDLQRLIGQGLIERLGNGGPASVYVMK